MNRDIINIIKEYIANKNDNSSIMINGCWGSGKTYFIKNILCKEINNAIYISLYGVKKTEEFDEKICYEIVKKRVIKKKHKILDKILNSKIINWIKNIFIFFKSIGQSVFKEKLGIDLSEIKKKDFVGIINQTTMLNNYVLIFDDLERCNIDTSIVLGYINNLVEHKNVKTIIVANEAEINSIKDENYELKIISCLNDKVQFPNHKSDNSWFGNTTQQDTKLTTKNIDERLNYLYSDNIKYKKIKEKLISNTIEYEPNIEEVINEFKKRYDKKINKYMDIDLIQDVLDINNCKNLRTLNVSLNYFDRIIKKIDKTVSSKYIDKKDYIYERILINVIFVTIAQKKGIYIPGILNGTLCTTVSLDKELRSNKEFFEAFSFVNDFISSGYFDMDLMIKTIDYYNEISYEPTNRNDPFTVVEHYWEAESSDLSQALVKLNEKIIHNEYNYKLYPKILSKLCALDYIDFDKQKIKEISDNMKTNISNSDIDYIDFHSFIEDKNIVELYNKLIEEFQNLIKNNKSDKYKTDLELLLDSENWGADLNNYVYENKNNGVLLNERGFLAKFDIDKIVNNLKKSNNKNIFYFKYAIDRVYNFSNLKEYFSADLENLRKLISELEKFKDSKDRMRKFALNYLHDTLVKKYEIIAE